MGIDSRCSNQTGHSPLGKAACSLWLQEASPLGHRDNPPLDLKAHQLYSAYTFKDIFDRFIFKGKPTKNLVLERFNMQSGKKLQHYIIPNFPGLHSLPTVLLQVNIADFPDTPRFSYPNILTTITLAWYDLINLLRYYKIPQYIKNRTEHESGLILKPVAINTHCSPEPVVLSPWAEKEEIENKMEGVITMHWRERERDSVWFYDYIFIASC